MAADVLSRSAVRPPTVVRWAVVDRVIRDISGSREETAAMPVPLEAGQSSRAEGSTAPDETSTSSCSELSREFAPSYHRATLMQAPLALVGCAAGIVAGWQRTILFSASLAATPRRGGPVHSSRSCYPDQQAPLEFPHWMHVVQRRWSCSFGGVVSTPFEACSEARRS